jgi:hypothetical protein
LTLLDTSRRLGLNRPRMSTDHGSPPALPEPETPTWLTVLGAALFLAVAAWLFVVPAAKPSAVTGANGAPPSTGAGH